MEDTHRSRLIWVAVALLIGLAVFAAAPLGVFAGGSSGSQEGGGDNPVVGSLPCAVDPDMDLKFWQALGRSPNTGIILRPVPTLSFAGPILPRAIADAWGAAGSVNAGGSCWSLLGLMQVGGMTTTRSYVLTSQALLWTWLPHNLVGGRITMSSNVGAWNQAITQNCQQLPLPMLCSYAPAIPVDATFAVYGPNATTPAVKYRVTVVGDVVMAQFL